MYFRIVILVYSLLEIYGTQALLGLTSLDYKKYEHHYLDQYVDTASIP
jgi:hypothetical protein